MFRFMLVNHCPSDVCDGQFLDMMCCELVRHGLARLPNISITISSVIRRTKLQRNLKKLNFLLQKRSHLFAILKYFLGGREEIE